MNITIPIEILTPKIPGKQDSVFYHGKNIARARIRNREYILTTAGEYCFSYKDQSGRERVGDQNSAYLKNDRKIGYLSREGLMTNWGFFGINVWEQRPNIPGLPAGKDVCLDYPTDVYSCYDEALKAFKSFIETDLKGESL